MSLNFHTAIIASSRRRVSLDADAATLIAAMTTAPDSARQTLISNTIVALKSAGIWDKLDEIWFRAAHTAQAGLLGWKRSADSATVGTVVFTTDRGFNRTAGGSYIDTGWNAGMASNFSQNSATLGFYSRTNVSEVSCEIGGRVAFNDRQIMILLTSGNFEGRINSNSITSISNGDTRGFHAASRTNAGSTSLYRNGTNLITQASDSSLPFDLNLFELGNNQNGSANLLSTMQGAFSCVGGSMTAAEHESFYDIVQDYMTAVGANV